MTLGGAALRCAGVTAGSTAVLEDPGLKGAKHPRRLFSLATADRALN